MAIKQITRKQISKRRRQYPCTWPECGDFGNVLAVAGYGSTEVVGNVHPRFCVYHRDKYSKLRGLAKSKFWELVSEYKESGACTLWGSKSKTTRLLKRK